MLSQIDSYSNMAAGSLALFPVAWILLQILLICNKKKFCKKRGEGSDGTKLLVSCSVTSSPLSQVIGILRFVGQQHSSQSKFRASQLIMLQFLVRNGACYLLWMRTRWHPHIDSGRDAVEGFLNITFLFLQCPHWMMKRQSL